MSRTIAYILFFLLTALLQFVLFDNLSVWMYFCPLVYVAFVALLPMDYPPAAVLLSGLLMGVAMDFGMGAAGENTIATVLVAFLRPAILTMIHSRDDARESGIPSPASLGGGKMFLTYLAMMIVLHHAVFFSLEALSSARVFHTVARTVISSAVSIVFVWLLAEILSSRQSEKRV